MRVAPVLVYRVDGLLCGSLVAARKEPVVELSSTMQDATSGLGQAGSRDASEASGGEGNSVTLVESAADAAKRGRRRFSVLTPLRARQVLDAALVGSSDSYARFSLFRAHDGKLYDGQMVTMAWREIARFIRDEVSVVKPKGYGLAIGLAAHEGKTPSLSTARSVELVHLDKDKGPMTMGQFVDWLKRLDLQAIVYPSVSAQEIDPMDSLRWRAIVRTTRFIPDVNYPQLWADRHIAVARMFEVLASDKNEGINIPLEFDHSAAKQSAVAYIHPSSRPRPAEAVILLEGSSVIDVDATLEQMEALGCYEPIATESLGEVGQRDSKYDQARGSEIYDALADTGYLSGPEDTRGWTPTRCPLERLHGSAAHGSATGFQRATGIWRCLHQHSKAKSGQDKSGSIGTSWLISAFVEQNPEYSHLLNFNSNKVVSRIKSQLRGNNDGSYVDTPLSVVGTSISKLTKLVYSNFSGICKDGAVLGVLEAKVGLGKSHEIPQVCASAKELCRLTRHSSVKGPSSLVIGRDLKAVGEITKSLKAAGFKVLRQQSILSVVNSSGDPICVQSGSVQKCLSAGVDPRSFLCAGEGRPSPCPKSRHTAKDGSWPCEAERGWTGDDEPDVIVCTHSGADGLRKFIKSGALIIMDESEKNGLDSFVLSSKALEECGKRTKHILAPGIRTAYYGYFTELSRECRKNPDIIGEPAEKREAIIRRILTRHAEENDAVAFMWRDGARKESGVYVAWKHECARLRREYDEAVRKFSSGEIEDEPQKPVLPAEPDPELTMDDAVDYAISVIGSNPRITKLTKSYMTIDELSDDIGGNSAYLAAEAALQWFHGANVCAERGVRGNELEGVYRVSWFGPATKLVMEHTRNRVGPAIVMDATACVKLWQSSQEMGRVEHLRLTVEDAATVTRVIHATDKLSATHTYDLVTKIVFWQSIYNALMMGLMEIVKHCPVGATVAMIARTPIALVLDYIWSGGVGFGEISASSSSNEYDEWLDDHPVSRSNTNYRSAIIRGWETCPDDLKSKFKRLRDLHTKFTFTHYGSQLAVGSNDLKNYRVFWEFGDATPPPQIAESYAAVTGCSISDESTRIARAESEQFFGRARAVRRHGENILFIKAGMNVQFTATFAEIVPVPCHKVEFNIDDLLASVGADVAVPQGEFYRVPDPLHNQTKHPAAQAAIREGLQISAPISDSEPESDRTVADQDHDGKLAKPSSRPKRAKDEFWHDDRVYDVKVMAADMSELVGAAFDHFEDIPVKTSGQKNVAVSGRERSESDLWRVGNYIFNQTYRADVRIDIAKSYCGASAPAEPFFGKAWEDAAPMKTRLSIYSTGAQLLSAIYPKSRAQVEDDLVCSMLRSACWGRSRYHLVNIMKELVSRTDVDSRWISEEEIRHTCAGKVNPRSIDAFRKLLPLVYKYRPTGQPVFWLEPCKTNEDAEVVAARLFYDVGFDIQHLSVQRSLGDDRARMVQAVSNVIKDRFGVRAIEAIPGWVTPGKAPMLGSWIVVDPDDISAEKILLAYADFCYTAIHGTSGDGHDGENGRGDSAPWRNTAAWKTIAAGVLG